MMVSKFWKALDELTDGGSSHWGWAHRLGDEWNAVKPFLPATGKMAASLPCPSPGGEGCPRQIMRHPDGTITAYCGDNPKACETLDLTVDTLRIHALDIRAISAALVAAMSLTVPLRNATPTFIMKLGVRERAAGWGVPVFLCIPGATPVTTHQDLDEILELPAPVLLLCPTAQSLPERVVEPLRRRGVSVLTLNNTISAIGAGKLSLTPQGNAAIQGLIDQLREKDIQAKGPQRAWDLPPGTQWEDMTIRFTAAAWINVAVGGVTRAFEPDTFGLRNTKKQETTFKEAWKLFLALAVRNGRHPVRSANAQETTVLQKNKQDLSRALRKTFGIDGDPITVVGNEYVTRFVLSADDLRQGRQGQSSTKFR